jgi:5-methylcytosine-specific restriction endonuclease McrA
MSRTFDQAKLDKIVADAHANRDKRSQGYREKAINMYPWLCGRCAREFTRENLSELTVHHRDHNHDNNPEDGSNWELLCLYCHDNEHSRYADYVKGGQYGHGKKAETEATHNPFAALKAMMGKDDDD